MQLAWILRYECPDLFMETLLVLRAKARAHDLSLDEEGDAFGESLGKDGEVDDGKFETSDTDRGKATPAKLESDDESAI